MGLLLSILVFSVGVLEALACARHIQQGILPAWAPRHVTTTSGRRLLRERWRKSTSRDEGGEIPVEVAGEPPPTPATAPSRGRPPPLQIQERQGSPALHRARTPDIHWPEPVPHSPVRNVEQTLPSPVEEVPGDLAWPQGDVLAGRRRTSVSETLPPVEHSHAEPLTPGSPVPQAEFARETQEPRRCKPAKASSFEEARVEPAFQAPAPAFPEVTPASRQPEVISLSYEDYSAAGPRAAVLGRIQITATKESSGEEEPELWPIVNIDTVATSDDEGDITPPPNSGSRRVSFDPIPTVVSFDREKPVAAEKKLKLPPPAPPTVKVTQDLEDLLREQIPAFVDQIIQDALLKATDVLSLRGPEGPLNGVSFFLKDVISNGIMGNENGEEYKDNFEGKNEEGSGVGDNIYRIVEKLQRGEEVVDAILPNNNKQKQETHQHDSSTTAPSMERPETETVLESLLSSEEERDTFHPNEVHNIEDIETLHSDNLELEDKYLEIASQIPANFENEQEIQSTYGQNNEVINTTNLSACVPDTNQNKREVEVENTSYSEEHLLQEAYSQERDYRNENEENMQFEIEECQLPNEPALVSNERSSPENISQQILVEQDTIPKESVQPNEQLYRISQEVPEENATSPPTPTSTTLESVASSAPLTTNNGPEEAKVATTLAKQVSPGSQGALDQAQITRAAAAADSAETRISSDEPEEFDIEPGSLASPDVRSAPQSPDEQSASQPSEELSPAPREELPSEGRSQETPSAAATAPPPSPPPSPPPQLASAPTTDKQHQATDSTPSADRNETSRTKEKKKKHILRKRSSKEKRGKRVQTPQASRSASEDEGEAPECATVAPVDAPPPPSPREPPPPAPAPPPAEQEPEDSARELTLGTSSSSTTSSSGCAAAAARPTTPAAAPQPEAFWVRDAPTPPSAPASATATPFGPSVKKPYRRKEPSETNMPGFAKSARFEWPPKPREERPVRPRSAAFSAAAPADPKEHFPPAPPPVEERPPTPLVPEPAPEQTLVSAASAPSPVPDASSPIPGATAPEQPVANGTAPDGTIPNGTATAEEADAARDEAASPAPGRFKFEVEMPTTRPTIQPVERDPKEVVRKLTLLKTANPGVASEMLMSILGFHCPH